MKSGAHFLIANIAFFRCPEEFSDPCSQVRNLIRQLTGSPRRLSAPKRQRRCGAMSILHPKPARLHTSNAPRGGAQQKDVTGETLNGKILINRSHCYLVWFRHHQVIGVIRNGTATCNCRQSCAAASPNGPIHTVQMQIGTSTPPGGSDAIGQHVEHRIKCSARQRGIRTGRSNQREQIIH